MVSCMNTDTKIFPQNICVPLILVFLCTHAFNFSSARLRVRQVFVRRLQVQRDVLRAAALPLRQDLRLPRQERRGQLPLPQPARRRPRVRGRGGPGERGQPLDPPRQGLRRLLRLPRPQRRGGPQLRQGEGVVRGEESQHINIIALGSCLSHHRPTDRATDNTFLVELEINESTRKFCDFALTFLALRYIYRPAHVTSKQIFKSHVWLRPRGHGYHWPGHDWTNSNNV